MFYFRPDDGSANQQFDIDQTVLPPVVPFQRIPAKADSFQIFFDGGKFDLSGLSVHALSAPK